MTYTTRSVPLLLLGLLACSSGGNVNIGDTQSLGGKLSDYAAEWDGYAEAYTFKPSSSDHIHMTLDKQGNGTIQVGTDALLPAATDPNLGYPPNSAIDLYELNAPVDLAGGVLYPLHAARVEANRIQFGLLPNDYYAGWCALQTSYRIVTGFSGVGGGGGGGVAGYGYNFLPGLSGGTSGDPPNQQCTVTIYSPDNTSTDQPVDCGKYWLSFAQVCTCTATSCAPSPALPADTAPAGYPAELDGALDSSGKALTGTLNLNGTRVTVHLTRK